LSEDHKEREKALLTAKEMADKLFTLGNSSHSGGKAINQLRHKKNRTIGVTHSLGTTPCQKRYTEDRRDTFLKDRCTSTKRYCGYPDCSKETCPRNITHSQHY